MNYLLKGETITFLSCLEALGKFTTMKGSLQKEIKGYLIDATPVPP